MDAPALIRALALMGERLREQKDWLSGLDAACGDGDHGVSVARGFEAVEENILAWAQLAPGPILRQCGRVLLSSTGGAIGPILATFFSELGKACGDSGEIDTPTMAVMLQASLDGVTRLGGARPGDKTLLDALAPAVDSLRRDADDAVPLRRAMHRAAEAAAGGARETAGLVARQGRARYLGERSIGHPDPGAHTMAIILTAVADAIREEEPRA
ncbi:MAG TPA: dihydroxyacetone kinase subunit DhaL [Bryobacteraceae bacterium]|nr:dihydroxyacetone kinase subunit DhaL [Bryobacteraceae bacterium]